MRVEILEKVMHGRDVYEAGEVRIVDEELGSYFCSAGWAKDLDGNVETAERDVHRKILAPDNSHHSTVAGEANG